MFSGKWFMKPRSPADKEIMRNKGFTSLLIALSLSSASALAANTLTYQGRIVRPDGIPVEAQNVTVTVQIRSPGAENCLIFEEKHLLDMRKSNGVFTINIGTGVRSSPSIDGGFSTSQIFSNKPGSVGPFPNCDFGDSYNPNTVDTRRLLISFNEGYGQQTLQAQNMNFVPFSIEATQVGGYSAAHLLRVDGTTTTPLTPADYTEFQALLSGTSAQYGKPNQLNGYDVPAVTTGQSVRWTGTAWEAYTAIDNTTTGLPNFTGNLVGDVTGTQAANTVEKIRGVNVSPSAPSISGLYLRFDGSEWAPAIPHFTDLKTSAGMTQIPTTCTNSEVMLYESATDTFVCQPISVGGFTGSLAGDVTGPQGATAVAKVGGVAAADVGAGATLANEAVATNTPDRIVRRDGFGNFAANVISATSFIGSFTGNVVGNVSGSASTFTGALGGDVIGTQGATVVERIQGQPVQSGSPSTGNILEWDGSQWAVKNGRFQNLKTSAGLAQFPVDCTSTQTLTYSSVSDTFICTNITLVNTTDILGGDVTGSVSSNRVTKLQNRDIASTAPADRQFLGWDGSQWTPLTDPWVESGSDLGYNGGNVAVGHATAPQSRLDVNGQILSRVYNAGGSTNIDWNQGNLQYSTASCGNFTFSNMFEGGSYTLVVMGGTMGICNFSQSSPDSVPGVNFRFVPENASTAPNKMTVFNFLRAGNYVFVNWSSGF